MARAPLTEDATPQLQGESAAFDFDIPYEISVFTLHPDGEVAHSVGEPTRTTLLSELPALHPLEQSSEGARAAYESAQAEFHRRLEKLTASAREALSSIQ